MPAKQETGAPAALRRLETHELECSEQVERLSKERSRLAAIEWPDGDEQIRQHRQRINDNLSQLADAQDSWNKSLKALREFDKSVSVERREGEKVSVVEAREIYEQLMLCVVLGVEAFILKFCQDCVDLKSPEDVYKAGAESIRQAMKDRLSEAHREKVIPKWLDANRIF